MRFKSLLKLQLLLLALLCFGSITAQAFTITRTSSPVFYIDSGANLKGMYVAYQITNTSATNYPDVWVGIDSFTGGVVSLAPGEDGVVQLGAMAPGQMKTAYFYLQASVATTNAQGHTVRVYSTRPPATQIDSASFSFLRVEETIQANANKITTTVSGPNPPGLGGIVTIQVTGHSGTIGSQNLLSFTPASELDWVADNYQLLTTSVVLSGGNVGTYNDQLYITGLASPSDTNYTVTYSFRATGVSAAPQRVTPMVYIASGTQIKHTQGDPQTISSATNSITLSKLVNPTQVYVGGTVTYTVRLDNTGGAYDVAVNDIVDTLPTSPGSPTYVNNSSAYGGSAITNPSISGSTLTWVGSFTVPAGLTRDLTFQVTFPNTAGTYTNTAVGHIGSTQIDTTMSTSDNAPATVNTTVVGYPDLTVAKSHTGNFTQGQNSAAYTITATNSGGSSTVGTVTVTDTLPSAFTYVSATGTGWTCSASGQTVTCTNSNVVAAGASFPAITLTVNVSATASASVTNSVSVSGGGETNTGNDSASDATTINQLADLTIAKSHTGNFTQGQTNASYTITATNSGNGSTSGTVTVTDTLPTGLTYSSAIGTGWTCSASGQTVTCTRSDVLGAGVSYPAITLNVNVSATASSSVTNSVSVSGGGEIITNNDSANDATTINQLADLTIAKTHSGNFTQGQTGVTYSVTVTNSGNGATDGTTVTVTDTLPASLTSAVGSGTGWTCSTSGQTVTCTRSTVLAAGASYPAITITANVSATAPSSVTNTASVSGGGEVITNNDSASDATTINQLADLTITKSHTGNFTQGQTNASYTLTVTNSGNGATSGTVTVTDTLPTGLTYSSASGTGWSCSASGQTVTCTNSNTLAAGASYPAITLNVNVATNAPASVTNTASVSGGGEIITNNDSSSDATTINQLADMTITKSHTGNFTRGSTGVYTITATNSGPTATSGTVTVTDTLPSGFSYSSATGTGWSCSASGQIVTCTHSTSLAAGASYPAISLTVGVAQNAASSITNSVSVSGGGEVITSNDSASDATTIVSSADLSLTNVVTSSGSGIGTNATFTVTLTNSGPSNATNVAVKDLLPSGLTYISSTPSTGTYNSATGIWTVTSLASGSSATLQLVGQINSLGSITTTAEVTASDQPDPDSTPNNHVATEDDQASASLSTLPPSITLCKTIQGQPCPPASTPSLPPGSDISYVITFTNTGGSFASSFVITDPVPANTYFKVGSETATLGSTGLSATLYYFYSGGSSFVTTPPTSGGGGAPAGYDATVTQVRWVFSGNLSQTPPNNTGNVGFTARIK